MYARHYTSEETNALLEAKRIIKTEAKAKREYIIDNLLRILLGIGCLFMAIITPILNNGECTFSIIMIFAALYFFAKGDEEY